VSPLRGRTLWRRGKGEGLPPLHGLWTLFAGDVREEVSLLFPVEGGNLGICTFFFLSLEGCRRFLFKKRLGPLFPQVEREVWATMLSLFSLPLEVEFSVEGVGSPGFFSSVTEGGEERCRPALSPLLLPSPRAFRCADRSAPSRALARRYTRGGLLLVFLLFSAWQEWCTGCGPFRSSPKSGFPRRVHNRYGSPHGSPPSPPLS